MGSVCFKIEKVATISKTNKVLARNPKNDLSEPKQRMLVKKNVLSVRKQFVVRKPSGDRFEGNKETLPANPPSLDIPCSESCASPIQEHTSPVADPTDSWMEAKSPRKSSLSFGSGVSVFKTAPAAECLLSKGHSLDSKATASTLTELNSAAEIDLRNPNRAFAPQTLANLDRVFSSELLLVSPQSTGSNKLSQVCKVRNELKRLAIGTGSL